MQVTPYQPTRGTTAQDKALAGNIEPLRQQESAPVDTLEARDAAAPAPTQAPPKQGLRAWDPSRHQRLTTARQARDYLRQLAAQLQRLKDQITTQLAAAERQANGATASGGGDVVTSFAQALQELDQLWAQRQENSGQTLDAHLQYAADGGTRQTFRLRGLDALALQAGAREVLTFSLAGAGDGVKSAVIDPTEPAEVNVRRLDQALSTLGVRVSLDGQGQPLFSASEAQWAKVRDGLNVRGEGRRFAAGQSHRVRAEVQPDAVKPREWKDTVRENTGMRQVLQAVMRALDRVKQAQREVSQALAEASAEMAKAEDPAQAVFAESFEAMTQTPDYSVYQQVAPALTGISRERVVALLSWSAGPAVGA